MTIRRVLFSLLAGLLALALLALLVIGIMALACPKPGPGKPVPCVEGGACPAVDTPLDQAQD
jgi:hypothetical protein